MRVVAPRSGTFGYGQAVMSGPGGVHFGGSEPRHDGAAIPQAPPVFEAAREAVKAFVAIGGRHQRRVLAGVLVFAVQSNNVNWTDQRR